jgi:hypothetical protein
MIAVLLDQGLAPRAPVILRERAFDAIHVMEIDSLDKVTPSVILLRITEGAAISADGITVWIRRLPLR